MGDGNSHATPITGRRRLQHHDCPIRDVLDRVGDAWSILAIFKLGQGPLRFNELKRQISGISQRMLTVTLRNLERDGLVCRTVIPMTPPQVEYALTPIGRSLLVPIQALADWAAQSQPIIQQARDAYDLAAQQHSTPACVTASEETST
ncbi:HxlR family transcriptional regulator [Pseudomonas duriflava]|uniref:HxlR family transcriptional regulator n=1 Tax=Pseudomonas duriflava TaxID=459528 RepID=A0A562QLL5_9PSED|nr:helix-turn-helix domain-containing protein [Pseudomonas duriflava]TWI57647.1 HxlR family transcriptional regulator [Pseudomonas duriflava]